MENKLNKIENIDYHDAVLSDYKSDGNNISFVIRDGWLNDKYYKIELKNIEVQVMNNKPELIYYVIDKFNSINKYNGINLYSGEFGLLEENNKYYLKLWIDHPNDIGVEVKKTTNEYNFDEMNVELCDDYDDTGRLYIKFLLDDLNVMEL